MIREILENETKTSKLMGGTIYYNKFIPNVHFGEKEAIDKFINEVELFFDKKVNEIQGYQDLIKKELLFENICNQCNKPFKTEDKDEIICSVKCYRMRFLTSKRRSAFEIQADVISKIEDEISYLITKLDELYS